MAFPFFLLSLVGLVMVGLVMDEPVGKSKGLQNTEKGKIEYLIKQVEGLKKAKFVRNDQEYDAPSAATFLKRKWANDKSIKTVEDFLTKIATSSSTSGKPYLIRFQDGKETKSIEWFQAELQKRYKKGE